MPIDGDRAMEFLRRLSFPRLGGSSGEKKAAEMIAQELREMGLDPRIEEFEIWSFANPVAKVQVLEPYTEDIEASALGLSGSTPPEGIEAPLRYIETGTVEFIHDGEGCITLATGNGGAQGDERSKKEGVGTAPHRPPRRRALQPRGQLFPIRTVRQITERVDKIRRRA